MGQDTYCYYGITYSCIFNKANLNIIKKIIDYQNGEDDIFVYIVDGNFKCKNISYKFVEKLYEYFEEKKEFDEFFSEYSGETLTFHYIIETCHTRGLSRSEDQYLIDTYHKPCNVIERIRFITQQYMALGIKESELTTEYRFFDSW